MNPYPVWAPFLLVCAIACAGCVLPKEKISIIHPSETSQDVDFDSREIRALQTSLKKISFPVKDGTVEGLLPHLLARRIVPYVGYFSTQGGKTDIQISEYRLNREYVLWVWTGYYLIDNKTLRKDDDALVMTVDKSKIYFEIDLGFPCMFEP